MDFSIPNKTQQALDDVRAFMETHLFPNDVAWLSGEWNEVKPQLDEKRRMCKAAGLWLPHWPAEEGGMGFGLSDFALLSEMWGQSPWGHYVCGANAPDIGNQELLHEYASPAQQARFLAPLLAGEIRSCFAMTEPAHAGSTPTVLGTTATLDGEDYVINGRKWFCTAADGADFTIAMVVTNPAAKRHQRASMLIVPMNTPGLTHVRKIAIMGHAGGGWASHSELTFDNCRVSRQNLLGAEGAGFLLAQKRLGPGRIHHCMRWLGIARRALDLTIAYSRNRDLAGEPLSDKQVLRHWIAEGEARLLAARWGVLQVAWTIENVGFKAARNEISMIKYLVSDLMLEILDKSLQAHGALGMSGDSIISWWYAHERAARIYDGPNEVHRDVVAKAAFNRTIASEGQ